VLYDARDRRFGCDLLLNSMAMPQVSVILHDLPAGFRTDLSLVMGIPEPTAAVREFLHVAGEVGVEPVLMTTITPNPATVQTALWLAEATRSAGGGCVIAVRNNQYEDSHFQQWFSEESAKFKAAGGIEIVMPGLAQVTYVNWESTGRRVSQVVQEDRLVLADRTRLAAWFRRSQEELNRIANLLGLEKQGGGRVVPTVPKVNPGTARFTADFAAGMNTEEEDLAAGYSGPIPNRSPAPLAAAASAVSPPPVSVAARPMVRSAPASMSSRGREEMPSVGAEAENEEEGFDLEDLLPPLEMAAPPARAAPPSSSPSPRRPAAASRSAAPVDSVVERSQAERALNEALAAHFGSGRARELPPRELSPRELREEGDPLEDTIPPPERPSGPPPERPSGRAPVADPAPVKRGRLPGFRLHSDRPLI
jgi:hypothetical protein